MADNELWDAGQRIFPICDARIREGKAEIGRFLGTGFWLSSDGYFATCQHVVANIPEGRVALIAQPYGSETDSYIPILEMFSHRRYDIAIGVTRKKSTPMVPYVGSLTMGQNVQAFGFSDNGKIGNSYRLNTRLLKGHVSCIADDPGEYQSCALLEISFAAPAGYSGAPLLVDDRAVGMIYGNSESTLDEYRREVIDENGQQYMEVRHRLLEYGLAHPWAAVQEAFDAVRQGMAERQPQ